MANEIVIQQLFNALQKLPLARSYDDLLLLKSYISKTEFITKDLAGVVNPRQMNDICRSLGLENFDAGEIIFNQGDTGDKVYIILTGKCEVRMRYRIDLTQGQSEIREKQLVVYSSGQYFGERALKFDEPRSASVICLENSWMITLHKSIYCEVLNEAKNEEMNNALLKTEQFGTKEGVIKILSKVREKRTPQELDGVASYLYRRIPFFQKFSMPHLIELCRVADSITIWGRSILFKQGQIGQAFYVILTGTVEVWVTDNPVTTTTGTNVTNTTTRNVRANDLTDGLGAKVNHLVTGDVFGERALENETSQRMASIITGDDSTELIVIAKEDYHNLVYVMMHADSMHKLQLLRRTELFNSLDIVHLRALSRFMEPRKFNIDEEVQLTGKKATELIIIEKGECRVVTEVQEGYERLNAEQKFKLRHKRYMEGRSSPETSSPRKDLVPVHPTPRRGDAQSSRQQKQTIGGGAGKEQHPKVAENHKLLRHVTEPDEQDEILQLSTKEIRKKSLQFAEKLKESMNSAILATQSSLSSPPFVTADREKTPIDARRNSNRFRSVDMTLIGKRKKIDLGRIAPNSTLALYVLGAENPHQDVYHSETVIASSLVTAYAIGKHDFFNHMPKDSLEAIVKVVREYKPPVLNPLWENAPRVLNENQWKMDKVWEKFRNQVSSDLNKDVNILDTMKVISRRHISLSSGNDPSKRLLVSRLDDLLNDGEGTGSGARHGGGGAGGAKKVDLNWGLESHPIDELSSAVHSNPSGRGGKLEVRDDQLVTRLPFSINQQTTNMPNLRLQPLETIGNRGLDYPEQPKTPSAAILNTVSNIIRNRINHANSNSILLEKLKPSAVSAGPNSSPNGYHGELAKSADTFTTNGANTTGNGTNTTIANKFHLAKDQHQPLDYPFALIHIHREAPHPNPIQYLGDKRRLLKTYFRLNGTFKTCSKAKQIADSFMEQIYLHLFQSTKVSKEHELVLHWQTFKGYEGLDVHDTDLFFIYCRSVPVEFASIKPSKNIFNATFPSFCKPLNQRFAVLVVNELNEKQTIQQTSRNATPWDPNLNKQNGGGGHHHHHHHHPGDLFETDLHNVYQDPIDDDEEDDETERLKNKARNNRSSVHPRRKPNQANAATTTNITTKSMTNPTNSFVQPIPSSSIGNPATQTTLTTAITAATAAAAAAATAGTLTNDRVRHLTNNEMIQLKAELSANGLPVPDFVTKRKPSMTAHTSMPLYLKELSVVYEVVAVTPSRLESVRYAVHRFGTVERIDSVPIISQLLPNQTTDSNNNNNTATNNTFSSSENNHKKKGKTADFAATVKSSPSKTIHMKSAQHFQNYTNQHGKLIHQAQRRPYGLDNPNNNNNNNNDPTATATGEMNRLESESNDSGDSNPDEEDDNNEGDLVADHNIYDPLQSLSIENPFLTTKLSIKPFDQNQPDRILKLLFHEKKKIVILPLFKWILINEDTLNTLDFLNIFDEVSIRKIYLAEEFEAIHQNQLSQTPGLTQTVTANDALFNTSTNAFASAGAIMTDYSDAEQTLFDHSVDPALIRSFTEAGLMPIKSFRDEKSTTMNTSQSLPEFIPSEKTKALEILQNEMLTKELSTSFNQIKDTVAIANATTELNSKKKGGSDSREEEKEVDEENKDHAEVEEEEDPALLVSRSGGIIVDISELQGMSSFNASANKKNKSSKNISNSSKKTNTNTSFNGNGTHSSSIQNNSSSSSNAATHKAMLIEQRLKALNATASEQMKIVKLHEKLSLKESKEMKTSENKAAAAAAAAAVTNSQKQQQNEQKTTSPTDELTEGGERIGNKQPSNLSVVLQPIIPFNPYQQMNSPQKNQLMQERLQLVESLQKVKTPSASNLPVVPSNPASNATNPPTGYGSTSTTAASKFPTKKSLKSSNQSNNNPSHHVESTAAGRRLAESLRVLSETLDSQFKK